MAGGASFNAVLLGYFFVRDMVPSKIGERLGEEDRGCTATDYFCDFGLCQGACARAGKNSIILFGHRSAFQKDSTAPNDPGWRNYSSAELL